MNILIRAERAEPQKTKRPKKRWLKLLIPLAIILVAVIAVILVIKGLNAPAVGSINQTPAAQVEQQAPYSQPGSYNGKYISFAYPAHYKIVPSKITGSYLEVVNYISTDQTAKTVAIGVFKSNVSSYTGVTYRQEHPEIYKEVNSRLGTAFTNLAGTEDTFFLSHGGLVASIAVSAPYQNLNGDADFIASSLHWK